jgi:hypothetical protein
MPTPSNLQFDSQVFDFAFHPTEDIIVAGLITGDLEWYLKSTDSFRFRLACCTNSQLAIVTAWKKMLNCGESDQPKSQSEGWNTITMAQVRIIVSRVKQADNVDSDFLFCSRSTVQYFKR